jgi:hypothetical protein
VSVGGGHGALKISNVEADIIVTVYAGLLLEDMIETIGIGGK